MTAHWMDQWQKVLDSGVDAVADVLTSQGPAALELRQNSPFAGVISECVHGSWHPSCGTGVGTMGSPARPPRVATVALIESG
jgi:hypothetical protein